VCVRERDCVCVSERERGRKRMCVCALLFFRDTMGWLRLVGSLKLQVSFAKEPYKRDDILQKRSIILRRLLIVATPYLFRPFFENFSNSQLATKSTSQHHCRADFYLGVATISRPLKITGLFGRIPSLLEGSFAKETYNF